MSRVSQFLAYINIPAKEYSEEWRKLHITDITITETCKQVRKENLKLCKAKNSNSLMPEKKISEYSQEKNRLQERGNDIEKLKKGLISIEYFNSKWS